MKDSDPLYIGHILEAIEKTEEYLDSVTEEQFYKSTLHIDAVARELSIIGEAANHLSEAFRDEHPEIPFRDIVSMRNFIIHEYAGTEAKYFWDTYKEDLPLLKTSLLPLRPRVEE